MTAVHVGDTSSSLLGGQRGEAVATRPLRVLVLHSRYLSGEASGENRVVLDEVRLLEDAGHSVCLLAPEPDVRGRMRRVALGMEAVWGARACREVTRAAARFKPDIVHVHNVFPALSPLAIRVGARHAPVVVTLHNYRHMCLSGTLLRDGVTCELCLGHLPWRGALHGCYRGSRPASGALLASQSIHRAMGTYARVDRYLAVSQFVASKHVQAGVPEERVVVRPNFTWPTPLRAGSGHGFLYAGRLSAEKGLGRLITLWRDVDSPLLVAGDGPERERLEAIAPRGVTFLGHVTPDVLAGLVRGARAILLPAISYEGSPRIVIEAFAAGVPAIGSDLGGLAETIHDSVSGLTVAPRDDRAWLSAIHRLEDDGESERMGRGAREVWERVHSPSQALRSLIAAYVDTLVVWSEESYRPAR